MCHHHKLLHRACSMSFRTSTSAFGLTAEQQIKRAREYVPSWADLPMNMFETKKISGGLTNLLSTVHLRSSEEDEDRETAVLFRQNGQGTNELINRKQEEKVIEYLSREGIYPKVYAQLEWGSIQHYMQHHRPLTPQEYRTAEFMPLVGSLLGRMHGREDMATEASITPGTHSLLPQRLRLWLGFAERVSFPDYRADQLKLAAIDLPTMREELEWLLNDAIPKVKSKIVLAHCDLQCGNVMWNEANGSLKMIDLEYADRMERGFDLGNCFCEMALNYCINGPPGFVINPNYYPNQEEQDLFLRAYCEGAGLDFAVECAALKREAEVFCLVSHFQWSLWSVIMAANSTIEFGYLDYALQRMTQYWAWKKKLLDSSST